MLNRLQLLGFMIMSTLGGLLGGSIAFGIVSGEFTPAWICLSVIVALFSIVFVIGSGSGEKPKKKKRVGDQHIGGEVLPEFKNN